MYCQDTQLIEPRQAELRSQCLELWQLPDRTRTAPQRSEAKVKFMELLNGENPGMSCIAFYDSSNFLENNGIIDYPWMNIGKVNTNYLVTHIPEFYIVSKIILI